MPLIDYDDFSFLSEDQCDQDEKNFHEDDPANDLDSNFEEDEVTDHRTDFDEYASFFTDYEKYQYDQLRWNGISNTRKYTIVKKKRKGRGEGENQKKNSEEDESGKQDKPKALPKPKKRGMKKTDVPLDQVMDIPKEGEIHFDARGNLWVSYNKRNIYVSERATYHHWIRPGLSQIENAKGTYDFPRKRGTGNYDVTCFNEVEQHWGLERSHYAPVMFEWDRMNRADPDYQLDSLYYQKLLVIDYWRTPVRNFREIPLVISSAFEGGFMEPATRLHSKMAYEDIRARMPPFLEVRMNGQIKIKALSKASTLSGRSRHFREHAGAISWDKREGSITIKSFIGNIVNPVNNFTQGSRDLIKDEVKRLRLMNHGTKPSRAKPGTSKEAKEKYVADTRKAAGIATAAGLPQNADGKNNNEQEPETEAEEMMLANRDAHQRPTGQCWYSDFLHDDEHLYDNHHDQFVDEPMALCEDSKHQKEKFMVAKPRDGYNDLYDDLKGQFVDNPMAYVPDIDYRKDKAIVAEARNIAPPRFVFCCKEDPMLQSMTEQQAATHPLVNMSDPRNHIPKTLTHVLAIRDALKVTIDHFKEILGFEPQLYEGSNYISEYCNIQDQMDEVFDVDAAALRRLGPWRGTILDWEQAKVYEDPCIGRKQPFGSSFLPAVSVDFHR